MTMLKLMYKAHICCVVYMLIVLAYQFCILYVAKGGFGDFPKCEYHYG